MRPFILVFWIYGTLTGVTPTGFGGTTLESPFLPLGKLVKPQPHENWSADDLLKAIAQLGEQAERGKATDAEISKNKGLSAYKERLKKSENEAP
jgi:hypothetical protein